MSDERIAGLEHRLALAEQELAAERRRLDWALGGIIRDAKWSGEFLWDGRRNEFYTREQIDEVLEVESRSAPLGSPRSDIEESNNGK